MPTGRPGRSRSRSGVGWGDDGPQPGWRVEATRRRARRGADRRRRARTRRRRPAGRATGSVPGPPRRGVARPPEPRRRRRAHRPGRRRPLARGGAGRPAAATSAGCGSRRASRASRRGRRRCRRCRASRSRSSRPTAPWSSGSSARIGFRRVEVRGVELLVNGRAVLIRGRQPPRLRPADGPRRRARGHARRRRRDEALGLQRRPDVALPERPGVPRRVRRARAVRDRRGRHRVPRLVRRRLPRPALPVGVRRPRGADDRARPPPPVDHRLVAGQRVRATARTTTRRPAGRARADPSRPLHYEGAIKFDWASATRPRATSCARCTRRSPRWSPTRRSGRQRHPLVMCEFSHAMGNSNGTLAEYWDAIESTPGLQGGFIWEWRDHGLDQRLPDGTIAPRVRRRLRRPAQRRRVLHRRHHVPRPQPEARDLRAHVPRLARPRGLGRGGGRGRTRGPGQRSRTAASSATPAGCERRGRSTADGETVAGGDLPLPSIAPGATAEVRHPRLAAPARRRRRALADPALPDGRGDRLGRRRATRSAGRRSRWTTRAGRGRRRTCRHHMQGWTGDVALDDEGLLLHPSFAAPPALSLWRAPTDNDRIGGHGRPLGRLGPDAR